MPYNLWYVVPTYLGATINGDVRVKKVAAVAKALVKKYGTYVVRVQFRGNIWSDGQALNALRGKNRLWNEDLAQHKLLYKAPKVKPPSDELWEHPLELCERCGNLLHRDAVKLEVVICDKCIDALRELANG